MRRIPWQSKTLILIILFIVLVFGGRYLFSNKTQYSSPTATSTSIEISDATDSTQEQQQQTANPSTSSVSTTEKKDASVSGCIADLQKKVKDEKIDYERGSILVGFNSNVSLADAEKVLAIYGSVIRDMQYAKENYDSRRIITASVKSGEEITKICTMKTHASIRYTGLNVLFTLHD